MKECKKTPPAADRVWYGVLSHLLASAPMLRLIRSCPPSPSLIRTLCTCICACSSAFALVRPRLRSCMCLRSRPFVCACVCARLYVFALVRNRLYAPAFVPVCKCLRSCSFVRTWTRLHPRPPRLSVPAVALVCPCHPRSYMTCVRVYSLSLACVRPVLSFCLWNFL